MSVAMKSKQEKKQMPERMRKTSLAIPEHLWKAAHIRALDEDADLQDIIAKALELYLKTVRKESQ